MWFYRVIIFRCFMSHNEHFNNVIVKIQRTIKNYVLIIYKYNLSFCTLNDFNNKHDMMMKPIF